MKWCGSLCRISNAVRLFHLLLTFFILYVLLKNPHSELNKAWRAKDTSFFVLISILTISLLLYLIASLIDPGYLPKAEPSLLDFTTNKATEQDQSMNSDHVELDALTDSTGLMVARKEGKGRFCRVCHCSQPMRSKHCYQCGRCIRKFDHHCPWLGNCVGERNHRFFWLFLGFQTSLLCWGVWISWTAIVIEGDTLDCLRANVLVFLSLFVVFSASILVGLLFLYHTYLVISGQTTWEQASRHRIHYLKDLQELSNPFNEGCVCNILVLVCSGLRDWEQVYTNRTKHFRAKSNV